MPNSIQRQISASEVRAHAASVALTMIFALVVCAATAAQGKSFKVLYAFKGGTDAWGPRTGLVQDEKGNLYGTAEGGTFDYGTVFKLNRAGRETILHSFAGGSDGAGPSGLIRDAAGNLYGTTQAGGNHGCHRGTGCGTVFKLSPTGKETILYRFRGGRDGQIPAGGLIRDAHANFYGTTELGGNLNCYAPYGCGTVFKLSTRGRKTILYSFTEENGFEPAAGVIADNHGDLFGTTVNGNIFGTVFKLSRTGKETTLYRFDGKSDGAFPYAGVIRDRQGNLYGTTLGPDGGTGSVFEITRRGHEVTLHAFHGGAGGSAPFGGVVRDDNGNLYGTTQSGGMKGDGDGGWGTVFELTKAGKEIVLHGFTGGPDGGIPMAGLLRDRLGNLYGTASTGGVLRYGVVFELTP